MNTPRVASPRPSNASDDSDPPERPGARSGSSALLPTDTLEQSRSLRSPERSPSLPGPRPESPPRPPERSSSPSGPRSEAPPRSPERSPSLPGPRPESPPRPPERSSSPSGPRSEAPPRSPERSPSLPGPRPESPPRPRLVPRCPRACRPGLPAPRGRLQIHRLVQLSGLPARQGLVQGRRNGPPVLRGPVQILLPGCSRRQVHPHQLPRVSCRQVGNRGRYLQPLRRAVSHPAGQARPIPSESQTRLPLPVNPLRPRHRLCRARRVRLWGRRPGTLASPPSRRAQLIAAPCLDSSTPRRRTARNVVNRSTSIYEF